MRFLILVSLFCSLQVFPLPAQHLATPTPLAEKPAASPAEKPPLAPRYRYYVGTEWAAQGFKVTSFTYPIQEVVIKPVSGYVGYQINPHLTLQVGFSQTNPPTEDNLVVTHTPARETVVATTYLDTYDGAVSGLLRYDPARRPAHRVFLNLLLGPTLLFHYYQADNKVTVDGRVTYETYDYAKARNWYLTGGLAPGYRLTPQLDVLVQTTANRNLTAPASAQTARDAQYGFAAGLRYGFDLG
ncbi:hypothetical protein AUC43_07535 [Hymenobacter sedentarius]|uniref:Outer membrane protein beta-barrel domain-containing protein n=1 Tax=Hymenobacter sedentarius TaxID=1411621 RepID=A0A0U4A9T8_9BACT|nr:hypothetical protein [Hymenobacter sedentarius]ALW84956.1 hypothetical protein AUC43_07535 [Hymenobacter sedentarius]